MDPQTVAKGDNVGHVGLHKVTGTTVEAIVGGVYHQFVRLSSFTPPPLLHPTAVLNRLLWIL